MGFQGSGAGRRGSSTRGETGVDVRAHVEFALERKETAMSETIFDRIIRKEIPARIEYEDERYIAIHDISPQAPVHLLVIPKKRLPTVNDLDEDDAELVGGMFLLARQLMQKMNQMEYRTVFNCGAGAGQSVFQLHLHVLAGRAFTWPPG
jgi:histidine triad (HIT) family protein